MGPQGPEQPDGSVGTPASQEQATPTVNVTPEADPAAAAAEAAAAAASEPMPVADAAPEVAAAPVADTSAEAATPVAPEAPAEVAAVSEPPVQETSAPIAGVPVNVTDQLSPEQKNAIVNHQQNGADMLGAAAAQVTGGEVAPAEPSVPAETPAAAPEATSAIDEAADEAPAAPGIPGSVVMPDAGSAAGETSAQQ
jgi:hypothetical protein